MHELSLANSLVRIVRSERAAGSAGGRLRVGLRIGAIAGIDTEALRLDFDALVRDTDLAGVTLDIECVPHRRRCSICQREFIAAAYDPRCPECGDSQTELTSGDELDISVREMEE